MMWFLLACGGPSLEQEARSVAPLARAAVESGAPPHGYQA